MNTTKSDRKLAEFRNAAFQSKRELRTFSIVLNANPEQIFPLLCSTREADWLPGSNHRLVYSKSGYAEDGYIFRSEFFDLGMETWVRYEHILNESLAYVRCSGNMSVVFSINLEPVDTARTSMTVTMIFTTLTEKGNTMLEAIPIDIPFKDVMAKSLQYYIDNGEQIPADQLAGG